MRNDRACAWSMPGSTRVSRSKLRSEQAGANEQHHRQRHFRNDEHAAGSSGPTRTPATALTHGVIRAGARALPGGHHAEHQRGDADCRSNHREHGPVDGNLVLDGARLPVRSARAPSAQRTPGEFHRARRMRRERGPRSGPAGPAACARPRARYEWQPPDGERLPRASNKLATLVHATRRTRPTAPMRARSAFRVSPTNHSCSGPRPTLICSFVSGYSRSRSEAIRDMSSCAAVNVTPGARRAITRSQCGRRIC